MSRRSRVLTAGGVALSAFLWPSLARADEGQAEVSETVREMRKAEEERVRECEAVEEEHRKEVQKARDEAEHEGKPEKLAEKLEGLENKRCARIVKIERSHAEKRGAILGKGRGDPKVKEDKVARELEKCEEQRQSHLRKAQEEYDREVEKAKEESKGEAKGHDLERTLLRLENKHNQKVERIEQTYDERRARLLDIKIPRHGKGEGEDDDGHGREKHEDGDDKDKEGDDDKGRDKGPGGKRKGGR